jgi:hypothetical protein
MSIFTKEVKFAKVVEMPDGVAVCYCHPVGLGDDFDAIKIETPKQAHELRVAVNKVCDIILGTKKGGK